MSVIKGSKSFSDPQARERGREAYVGGARSKEGGADVLGVEIKASVKTERKAMRLMFEMDVRNVGNVRIVKEKESLQIKVRKRKDVSRLCEGEEH